MKSQFIRQFGRRLARVGVAASRRGLNALMPPHCPVTLAEVATPGALGPLAWGAAHFIEDPYCPRCGVPFAADYGEDVECPACIATPPDFDRARAAVAYDDASHRLVVSFKHSDRTELAPMFAAWMARAGAAFITKDSVLTPVPLHRRRLMTRRYNQSALIAKALAGKTGARLSLGAFIRNRATPPQKDLSADARRRNVSGAFGFSSDRARGSFTGAHVILIDDVLTTGATLSAAARALRRAGAARVDALVLARVVKGGVGAI